MDFSPKNRIGSLVSILTCSLEADYLLSSLICHPAFGFAGS